MVQLVVRNKEDDDDDDNDDNDGVTAVVKNLDLTFIKFQNFNHVSILDLFKTNKLNFMEAGAESIFGIVIRILTQELDL